MSDKHVTRANQFISCLQMCRQSREADATRLHYFHICEIGLEAHEDLANYLVSTLVECRSLPDALHLFNRLDHPNEFAWTSVIQGWTACGHPENSVEFFDKMQEGSVCVSKHTYVAVLKACAQLKLLEQGQGLHSETVQKGYEDNAFVGNSIIDLYAKVGLLLEAQQVFEHMENQNVVSWNALITGHVEHGCNRDALSCLEAMESRGMPPDYITLACGLKACSSLGDVDKGYETHTKVMLSGEEKAQMVSTALADMYVKCGLLMDARAVFDQISDQTVALWTILITGYCEEGHGEESLKCLEQMQLQGLSPDDATYICTLKACSSIPCINKGQAIHTDIVAKGIERDFLVSNTLLDMYVKCASLVEARHIFDQRTSHTIVSWNVLIRGYVDHGQNEEALSCLKRMEVAGMSSDVSTFCCRLRACGNLQVTEQGQVTHVAICKEGWEKDLFIGNTLVDMYAKCGLLVEARMVFDRLPVQSLVSWNALIAGYVEHACGIEALNCLDQMLSKGMPLDNATFICCLKACGDIKLIVKGRLLHIDIVKVGFESDPFVGNGLVDMYAKCGCFAEAQGLFDLLEVRNVVSWSTLVAGFAEHGHGEKALDCLRQMKAEGVLPNNITYICSMKACGSIGALDEGMEIHAKIMGNFSMESSPSESGHMSQRVSVLDAIDVSLTNALIDMYCKCGSMMNGEKLFEALPFADTVSWNSLMAGYSRKGESQRVLHLFKRMGEQNICPDRITYLNILNACSHAGLVDAGQNYFDTMYKEHGIQPAIVHYNCLIDLLGRAGRLIEAFTMLKRMPVDVKPDVATWYSLLGSCSNWGDVKLGRLAFEYAVRLDKSNAAVFFIMSNMYADANMWEEVRNIESIMEGSMELGSYMDMSYGEGYKLAKM